MRTGKRPPPNKPIRIMKPGLDDAVIEGNPCLRGVIAVESLADLKIDTSYQREFLSTSTRRWIMDALAKSQRLPDLELGMRGLTWGFDESQPAGSEPDVLLLDPVYIIDGQQRRGSITEFMSRFPTCDPRQGVVVHFGSSVDWERERFEALNLRQTRMSSGVVVRNMREKCRGVATIYGLTINEPRFALFDRVGWGQNLGVKDLLSGTGYAYTILTLHGHMGGGIASQSTRGMQDAFDRLVNIIGLQTLRENIMTFWELVDRCWGVRTLTKRGSTWMKSVFLFALCEVLSDHLDFWQGNTLVMSNELRERLKRFPVTDPEIRNLAGSSGQARSVLVYQFISHLDKGRRSSLRKRNFGERGGRHSGGGFPMAAKPEC